MVYDERQYLKQPDWTYLDAPPDAEGLDAFHAGYDSTGAAMDGVPRQAAPASWPRSTGG